MTEQPGWLRESETAREGERLSAGGTAVSEPVTNAMLAEWERLAAEATPPPWRAEPWEELPYADLVGPRWEQHGDTLRASDAAFIAASREALPALCAEVRRLRQAEHDLRSELASMEAAVRFGAVLLWGWHWLGRSAAEARAAITRMTSTSTVEEGDRERQARDGGTGSQR